VGGSKAGDLPHPSLSLSSPFPFPLSFQTNQWEGRSDPVRGKFPGFPPPTNTTLVYMHVNGCTYVESDIQPKTTTVIYLPEQHVHTVELSNIIVRDFCCFSCYLLYVAVYLCIFVNWLCTVHTVGVDV